MDYSPWGCKEWDMTDMCTRAEQPGGAPSESDTCCWGTGSPRLLVPSDIGGPHGCGPAAWGGHMSPRPGGRVTADRPGGLGASPEQP